MVGGVVGCQRLFSRAALRAPEVEVFPCSQSPLLQPAAKPTQSRATADFAWHQGDPGSGMGSVRCMVL